MPKAKSKRRKPRPTQPAPGDRGRGGKSSRNKLLRAAAVVVPVALVIWLIVDYFTAARNVETFQDLALRGRGVLERVESPPNEGRRHLPDGTPVAYRSDPPTSGAHSERWVDPGVYRNSQPPERLVHSLEHGMIVIYYDQPAPEVMDRLEFWASLFRGVWSGIVLVPRAGLGREIILTAWRRRVLMAEFDAAEAAAFIDAYRGRGPENRVR